MVAVGEPLWLATDGPSVMDASVSQNGIDISLTAHRTSTTFTMGDGNTVNCTTMTPWPGVSALGQRSPDCGYTYQRHGSMRVSATTTWVVDWSALGYGGALSLQSTGSRVLTVGQLSSVVVG